MKPKAPAVITFRAKVRQMIVGDAKRAYVDYKAKVSRSDCDLKPHQHYYFNSDLFPSMLQRAYETALGGKRWGYLDALPDTVTVDASGFLACVTVRVEV
jgi:hypothetical protein